MSGPADETRGWLVSGRVQGVAFRASARRRARELALDGVAENLPDGRVRVVATGAPNALERFADWLADGPPAARVDRVERIDVDAGAPRADGGGSRSGGGFTTG